MTTSGESSGWPGRIISALFETHRGPMIASMFFAGVAAILADWSGASPRYWGFMAWAVTFPVFCGVSFLWRWWPPNRFRALGDRLASLHEEALGIEVEASSSGEVDYAKFIDVVHKMRAFSPELGSLGINMTVAEVYSEGDVAWAANENAETLGRLTHLAREGAMREARRETR